MTIQLNLPGFGWQEKRARAIFDRFFSFGAEHVGLLDAVCLDQGSLRQLCFAQRKQLRSQPLQAHAGLLDFAFRSFLRSFFLHPV